MCMHAYESHHSQVVRHQTTNQKVEGTLVLLQKYCSNCLPSCITVDLVAWGSPLSWVPGVNWKANAQLSLSHLVEEHWVPPPLITRPGSPTDG